jgi:hypothetical protein
MPAAPHSPLDCSKLGKIMNQLVFSRPTYFNTGSPPDRSAWF